MKRRMVLFLIALLVLSFAPVSAQRSGRSRKPKNATGKTIISCVPLQKALDKQGINGCPPSGCGELDVKLNEQKNLAPTGDIDHGEKMDLTDLRSLPDKKLKFQVGADRKILRDLGEGKRITVVGYALVARKGNPESCNCKLSSVADTDNHIVLVSKEELEEFPAFVPPTNKKLTKKQISAAKLDILHQREENSVTAEFTPRVRLTHPKLSRAMFQPFIDDAPEDALLVRVTGLLLFDSEHAQPGRELKRHNNWEIHPVLKMEFCPTGKTCTKDSNKNWEDLEDQP